MVLTSKAAECIIMARAVVHLQCRFTSTETIRTVRDGEPRTATSTFTQLLSSDKAVNKSCEQVGL